jgi:hypothetical protein
MKNYGIVSSISIRFFMVLRRQYIAGWEEMPPAKFGNFC